MTKYEIKYNLATILLALIKFVFQVPTTSQEWLDKSKVFNDVWNFPHCIGAMDGKHVLIQAPFNSGTEFYNYKSTFSIVLFALVDADYNFIFVDAGCQERISDGGVFKDTILYRMIENKKLGLPNPEPLPNRNTMVPYFIVADSAFALSENVMKPYAGTHVKGSPKRIFNYRLSRARRVVENAFGIISSARTQ